MLARTLYAFCSDDTTDNLDMDDGVDVENYHTMKEWMGLQWEKMAGRNQVKSYQKPSTKM